MQDLGSPLTYSTTCWWCGDPVFFHTNGFGDCVLFDELGWPWPIHSCWERHVAERSEALRAVTRSLAAAGFDGRRYPAQGRHIEEPPTVDRPVQVVGYVAARRPYREDAADTSSGQDRTSLPVVDLVIADSQSRLWHLLVPASAAGSIQDYQLVSAAGAWVRHGSGYRLLATALELLRPSLRASRGQVAIEKVDCLPLLAWARAVLDTGSCVLDTGSCSILPHGLVESLLSRAQHVPIAQLWDELRRSEIGHQLPRLQVILTRQLKHKFNDLFRRRALAPAEGVLSILRVVGDPRSVAWIERQEAAIADYRALGQIEDKWQKYEAATRLPYLTQAERVAVARELWAAERECLQRLIQSASIDGALDLFWRLKSVAGMPADLDRSGIRIARALEERAEALLSTDPAEAATKFEAGIAVYVACHDRSANERRREAFLLEGLAEAYETLGRMEMAILCYERMRKDAVEPDEPDDVVDRLATLYEKLGLGDRGAEVLEGLPQYEDHRTRLMEQAPSDAAHERWRTFLGRVENHVQISRLGMKPIVQDLRAYEEFRLG